MKEVITKIQEFWNTDNKILVPKRRCFLWYVEGLIMGAIIALILKAGFE